MKVGVGGLSVVAVFAASAALAAAHAGPPPAARVAVVTPPTIHERFTLLPCPSRPQTTLGLEGCAEHDIVRADKQIDGAVRVLFGLLPDDSARRDLAAAQRAWLAYRLADCSSMSDKYEHGTLAGVVAANCTAARSRRRLADLRTFEHELRTP
jgi:uncharacterized protein YecT (DUF1311 family)